MRFFNTLTRQIDDFKPIDQNEVKIYTCGPTVYDFAHIGNFTAYVYWDLLVRTLQLNGYRVKRVMNLTDVGHLTSDSDEGQDKMEKSAKKQQKTVWQIAEFFTDDFLRHFRGLNCTEPVAIAKATDYIFEDLQMIKTLTEKGYAYTTTDGIYYDTSKFPRYADFGHLDLKGLEAGARVDFNAQKRHLSDFALWKFIAKHEDHAMQWPLPDDIKDLLDFTAINQKDLATDETGAILGYPGWHIECSCIIHSLLGETIDIHTGGIDHIPVHHTNEIAQSEAAFGKILANYWLHNNFITIDGAKISKSKGNILTFYDLEQKGYNYMDYRMWVLQGHFSSERNFSWENLAAAHQLLTKWRNFAALRWQVKSPNLIEGPVRLGQAARSAEHEMMVGDFTNPILEGVNNNLTSAQTIAKIDELMPKIYQNPNNPRSDEAACNGGLSASKALDFWQFIDDLLGLNLLNSTPNLQDEAYNLIKDREAARTSKNWQLSDQLRDQITETYGVVLRDTDDGTIWEYK
ncbi:MAG: cysteine--tRNA ligase [Candidatus Nomurabacteria bacterium]|jgi:cysteinyl-tRNA synthetase|nr:cysteine--tRNA ligase [Candidatus Nomurabacteria bacterium]